MSIPERLHELIARHQMGAISEAEHTELEAALLESSEARMLFHCAARIDGELWRQAEVSEEENSEPAKKVLNFQPRSGRRFSWLDAGLAAAVLVLLGILATSRSARPEVIATLVSAEDASWESALPTTTGSELSAGEMKLNAGIATIRFRSGAKMTIEAPASIALETAMRARLATGAVVLDVPESAIGFVLATPDGHVVDHGTSFAVSVNDIDYASTVEVIEGEVSLHLAGGGETLRLFQDGVAAMTKGHLTPLEERSHLEVSDSSERIIRIGTDGRSHSVHRANKEKWMHPDKLMVKRRLEPGNHERRSFFSFDLSTIDLDEVESARLRLNQVPSGIGYASRLPKISDVAVYGITEAEKVGWPVGALWEDGPLPEDGKLLGHLAIPRSQQRGSRIFDAPSLLEFLQFQGRENVTFLLDGATDPLTGETVSSMVIAFASDAHAESAGPVLEFVMRGD